MPYSKHNGGSRTELDVDHELPSAEGEESAAPATAPEEGGKGAGVPVAELETELEKARAECAAYLDRAARLQAEFENFRKRNAKEQQEYREYALAEALRALLPILDSLDRALKSNAASLEDFRSGIELIDRQFHDVLARLGVQPVPAQGELFDPNLHQAVQMVDTDEAEDNHVLDELQRGYRLRDRLLRPAMVRVARNTKSK
ncbi:MAG TPA: nucleotide exchange factor GrpE [Candidatus Binatia bacterium]|nr:nucleotide exchange factor GrpE [Candidatus Binatia bacterium]